VAVKLPDDVFETVVGRLYVIVTVWSGIVPVMWSGLVFVALMLNEVFCTVAVCWLSRWADALIRSCGRLASTSNDVPKVSPVVAAAGTVPVMFTESTGNVGKFWPALATALWTAFMKVEVVHQPAGRVRYWLTWTAWSLEEPTH
jgi:hypothetical protein